MTYDHTQKSPLYLVLLGLLLVFIGIGLVLPARSLPIILLSCAAAILIFCVFSFKHLRVRDEGDHLAVRFGPLPIFCCRIPYARITGAEAGRSSFWDGWGIHYMPGRGWIYNLWGLGCVKVRLGRKTLRIGTDDVDGLVRFLNSKIGGHSA